MISSRWFVYLVTGAGVSDGEEKSVLRTYFWRG